MTSARATTIMRLLQMSTVSQSWSQDCPDFAERMKCQALRMRGKVHVGHQDPTRMEGAYSRMWPKPNPESNTAIRLYATVSKNVSFLFRSCTNTLALPPRARKINWERAQSLEAVVEPALCSFSAVLSTRGRLRFSLLEVLSSCVGKEKFHRWKDYAPPYCSVRYLEWLMITFLPPMI